MRTNTWPADAQDGPDGPGLTPLRREIIKVIGDSVESRGYSPSYREIGEAVGLASTSSVAYQMSVLKAMGYVSRQPGQPRTVVLRLSGQDDADLRAATPGDGRMAEVPLVGRIAAGTPLIADQVAEDVITIPRMLTGEGSLIALRVSGDSMTGAAIADGDLVIVREQPDAESGDIVAAMLPSGISDDYEATVKTLKKTGGHVWLLPHNPAYSPILADSSVIIGRVVSVLRRLLRPRRPLVSGPCAATSLRSVAAHLSSARARHAAVPKGAIAGGWGVIRSAPRAARSW
jgi:repressor LexA